MRSYNWTRRKLCYAGGSTLTPQLRDLAYRTLTVTRSGTGNRRMPVAQSYSTSYKQGVFGTFGLIDNLGKPVYKYNDEVVWDGSLSWYFGAANASLTTAAYNNAVSSLYDQVRGGLDLSVDIAEAKQTSRMIAGAWATASSGCLDYARRAVSDAKRQGGHLYLKFLGKAWLSYKYGWAPLLQTAYDLTQKAFSDPGDAFRVVFKARGSATANNRETYDIGVLPLWRTNERSARCELGVAFSPRTSRTASLAGFTSLNPVSLAWELLPYSFVADWFVDVGGYLRAAESALLYRDNFLYGYRTDTYQHVVHHALRSSVVRLNANERLVISGCDAGGGWSRTKDRSILTGIPFPARPVVNTNLGASRLASAASLLSQFLGRR